MSYGRAAALLSGAGRSERTRAARGACPQGVALQPRRAFAPQSAAEARFKEAVEAYELLGDAARRRDFDAESRGFGGDYGGVDDATAREWARAAADQTRWERAAGGAWGPRYTHSARAGNEEWRSFDFEEWNRMHYGPSSAQAGQAAREAAQRHTRQARRARAAPRGAGAAEAPGASSRFGQAAAQPFADRAGTETDFHWRRLHRMRRARQLSRWAVPAQVAAFACVGVAVWAGASGLFDPPSNQ